MSLNVITPPSAEPLTLEDAKSHLRIGGDEDDALIASYISAARRICEVHTARAIPRTTFLYTLDAFPPTGIIKLPNPPLISVEWIRYIDSSGDEQTLSPSDYLVDLRSEPGRVSPAFGRSWHSTREQMGAVQVCFTAGYGDGTEDITPEGIKQAMRLLVGTFYENRESMSEVTLYRVPGVDALLSAYCWGAL